MCEAKPGQRCAGDTKDCVSSANSEYAAVFGDSGPQVDPLTNAQHSSALTFESRSTSPSKDASPMSLHLGLDLNTAGPAQIDGLLVPLEEKVARVSDWIARITPQVNEALAKPDSERSYSESRVLELHAGYMRKLDALERDVQPLRDEYNRRGGWQRYFLVTNTNGHVHTSTSCQTCRPNTNFAVLTEQSGMKTDDLVEMAGEDACTVCFPGAPVATLSRPSRLETPEAKAKREAKEAAQAAKAAKSAAASITMPDGAPVLDEDGRPFKTERAATNARTAAIKNLAHYNNNGWGTPHPSSESWIRVVRDVNAAMSAKHGRSIEDESAEALKKAQSAYRREFGGPMPTPHGL